MRLPLRREQGSATLELIVAVGLLLIPATALIAQLPGWIKAGHAAQAAASEAARQVVLADTISQGMDAAQAVTVALLTNHGFTEDDLIGIDVVTDPPGELQRGQVVTATVTVQAGSLVVPGIGTVGDPFTASGSAHERVDDYRSLGP